MGTARIGAVRRVFDRVRERAADHDDGDLLERFRRGRDDAAFGSLVSRHGPMVLGVCRRVLGDPHAAEDAFQATFLVLAKRAGAVRPPGILGAWLHGVAYRTALKARGREYRRRVVERHYLDEQPRASDVPQLPDTDLGRVIDQQVNALPEKYRSPLLLCAVQGLGKAEAAARLGVAEGTVSSRLARAREMLRDRLTRRGVVVPAAGAGVLLAEAATAAAVPPALTIATTEMATGLAPAAPHVLILSHEVLTAMTLTKWKILSALAVAVTLGGGGVGVYVAQADEKKPAAEKPGAVKPAGEKPGVAKPGAEKPGAEGTKPNPGTKPGQKVRKYAGQIGAIDTAGRTITLVLQGEGGPRESVVKLTADAAVTLDGKEVKLDALPQGATADCVIAGGGGKDGQPLDVSAVSVNTLKLNGVIKETTASTVTILGGGPGSKLADRVLKIAPGGRVLLDGKEVKPTELQAGDRAAVFLAADGTVELIRVGSKGEGDKPGVKPKGEGDSPKPGL